MGATAAVTLGSTVTGLPEGGAITDQVTFTNTSAAYTVSILTLTTLNASAQAVVIPTSGNFILAVPTTPGSSPWFATNSTGAAGIKMTSNGFYAATVVGGSSVYFYSQTSIFPLRVITY